MVGVVGAPLTQVLAPCSPWRASSPLIEQLMTGPEPQLVQDPLETSEHRRGFVIAAKDGVGDSAEEAGEAPAELNIEEEQVIPPLDAGTAQAHREGHRPTVEAEASFHDGGVSLEGGRQDGEQLLQVPVYVPMPMHPGNDNPAKATMKAGFHR